MEKKVEYLFYDRKTLQLAHERLLKRYEELEQMCYDLAEANHKLLTEQQDAEKLETMYQEVLENVKIGITPIVTYEVIYEDTTHFFDFTPNIQDNEPSDADCLQKAYNLIQQTLTKHKEK